MKYKIGDKVRIVKEKPKKNWAYKMDKRLGKVMTIREINNGCYEMGEDKEDTILGGRIWEERMIEGLAEEEFKEGEVVLVRDNKEITEEKRIYLCTIPGNLEYKYVCIEDSYEENYKNGEEIEVIRRKNIKKIPKEEKKIIIELTEEQLEKIKQYF